MASVAQIQANRSNAQKSTGPHTPEGKERASRNALKHGLLAREAVIQGEDPEEFELSRDGMLENLAQRVVSLSWRLRRAERLQNGAFAALDDGEPTALLEARHEEWKQLKGSELERSIAGLFDEDAALGKAIVEDFGGARVLDRLLMYERRIENSLYRTMAELRKEREARTAAAGSEEVSHMEGSLTAGQESVASAELASFGADEAPEGGARAKTTPDGVTTSDERRATQSPAETLHASRFTIHCAKRTQFREEPQAGPVEGRARDSPGPDSRGPATCYFLDAEEGIDGRGKGSDSSADAPQGVRKRMEGNALRRHYERGPCVVGASGRRRNPR